jgi:hypothetical protein
MVLTKLTCLILVFANALSIALFDENLWGMQHDEAPKELMCSDIFAGAISVNEGFKRSLGSLPFEQQHDLRIKAEKYYDEVLIKNLTRCSELASKRSDMALSKKLFDLALSYVASADELIGIALAKYYCSNQTISKEILLSYEIGKRSSLIEEIKEGLEFLYYGRNDAQSQLNELRKSLDKLLPPPKSHD